MMTNMRDSFVFSDLGGTIVESVGHTQGLWNTLETFLFHGSWPIWRDYHLFMISTPRIKYFFFFRNAKKKTSPFLSECSTLKMIKMSFTFKKSPIFQDIFLLEVLDIRGIFSEQTFLVFNVFQP